MATLMGQGTEDHFFHMARTSVARFHPADAILAHRALANDVLQRTGFKRRQGVLALRCHSALFDHEMAARFLAAGQASQAILGDDEPSKDEWLIPQFSILMALPHLTPDQQLDAVDGMNIESVLLDILNAMTPAPAFRIEEVLQRAVATGDEKALVRILAAICYSRPQLSVKTLETAAQLTLSPTDLIRSLALGICAASGDASALEKVVSSGWAARTADGEKPGFEPWYGSQAILEAAKKGLISLDDALDRMSLCHFGFAAIALGSAAAAVIAGRIEQALDKALDVEVPTDLPGMRTCIPEASDTSPPLMSLDAPPAIEANPKGRSLKKSEEDFDLRQQRWERAFRPFVKQVSAADAGLILSDLTLEGTIAILDSSPDVRLRVLGRLSAAMDSGLRNFHHIAVQVGIASTLAGLPEGTSLLRRVMKLAPTVQRVRGMVKLPAEALYLWRHADNASCADICRERLTTLNNDRDLSLEVLAALMNNRESIVRGVVDDLLATREPAHICRAVTIAGFSDVNPHSDGVLGGFATAQGYVGVAVKAAQGAYDRNRWARHWYEEMKQAETNEVFWSASVLFVKVIDARFALWRQSEDKSTLLGRFWSSLIREVENRIDKWHNKRKSNTFGDDQPSPHILKTR